MTKWPYLIKASSSGVLGVGGLFLPHSQPGVEVFKEVLQSCLPWVTEFIRMNQNAKQLHAAALSRLKQHHIACFALKLCWFSWPASALSYPNLLTLQLIRVESLLLQMDFHSKALIFGFPQSSCKNRLQLPGKTRAMKIPQPIDTCGHVHFVEDYHTGFIDLLYTPSLFKSSKSYGLNPSGWDARRTSKWKWFHVIYIYIYKRSEIWCDMTSDMTYAMIWNMIWYDMMW